MEKKYCVYICKGCGIKEAMDVDKVAGAAKKVQNFKLHDTLCSPEGVQLIKDGTEGPLTPPATTGAQQPPTAGWAGKGAGQLVGSIAAALVYSKVHTDAERKQVEQWLGTLYGITVAP